MSSNSWNQTIVSAQVDGTANTSGAAASCIPPHAVFPFPGGTLKIGDKLCVRASGRISSAVTTPGTARLDFRIGGNIVFDSQQMLLNVAVQTNIGWWLDVEMTVRAVGTAASILGQGTFTSMAMLNTAAPATGPFSGVSVLPYNTAPVVGATFNSTTANNMDMFFTQTVATGSFQVHQYELIYKT